MGNIFFFFYTVSFSHFLCYPTSGPSTYFGLFSAGEDRSFRISEPFLDILFSLISFYYFLVRSSWPSISTHFLFYLEFSPVDPGWTK